MTLPLSNENGLVGFLPPTISSGSGLSIGGAIASGTSTRVLFEDTGPVLADDAALTFVKATGTLSATAFNSASFTSATTQSFTLNSVLSATLGVAAASVPDADVVFGVGRFLCDSRTTDTVNLSHRDNTGTTSWAIQFGATGFVGVNALTGSSGALRANNVTKFAWSTAGLSFFNATVAAQQNITGSRGGNAALADLLTKLATIGLITDGTSA